MEFIVVIIVLIVCYKIIRFVSNCLSPLLEREACVIKKRRRWVTNGLQSITVYYVTFKILDDTHQTFRVSRAQYRKMEEGDNGRLLTKGTWYWEFSAHRITSE